MAEPKNKEGRPLSFKSVEELETKIQEYFDSCYCNKIDDLGISYKENIEPITMSGLAYALGVNRKTIVNYSHKEQYFPTISRAREKAEAYMEKCLYTNKSVQGIMFAGKNNYGWVDKSEVETTTKEITVKEKTTEELLNELKDLENKK